MGWCKGVDIVYHGNGLFYCSHSKFICAVTLYLKEALIIEFGEQYSVILTTTFPESPNGFYLNFEFFPKSTGIRETTCKPLQPMGS